MPRSYLVLSVDDEPLNHTVLQTLVPAEGYELHSVMSGQEALAYLQACDAWPDLVLLDCMMPGLSGYEVLEAIAKDFAHARCGTLRSR